MITKNMNLVTDAETEAEFIMLIETIQNRIPDNIVINYCPPVDNGDQRTLIIYQERSKA